MSIQSLEGLWVLQSSATGAPVLSLVATESEGRRFLLAFGDARKARNFTRALNVQDTAPLLVCRANLPDVGRAVNALGASGVLLDFDPATGSYQAAPFSA